MLNAVMLDLETMGSGNKAAVIAIGAFKFDLFTPQPPEQIEDSQRFYVNVNLKSSIKHGLEVDGDTILWWMKQSAEARKPFEAAGMALPDALQHFSNFMATGKYQLWGNGATFDNVILRSAYDAAKLPAPWHYTKDMCYRTFKNLFGKQTELVRNGTHHNALDDAITQALHLQKIMATIQQSRDPQTTLQI